MAEENLPSIKPPEVQYMAEGPGEPVGVDFDRTVAEFAKDASLGFDGLKAGDVITVTTDSYGAENEVKLPVTEILRDGMVHGKPMGTQVMVDYNGGRAALDGSKFSTLGSMRRIAIQAGTYPLLRVPNPEGGRPKEELLDRTKTFKVERPNADGVLEEVPLNALDKQEPYESPNQELIQESDNVLGDAIATILPGVDLKYGVRGKIDAGDSGILLDIKSDGTQILVLDKTTGKLTKLSRFPNGSLVVRTTEIPAEHMDDADKQLGWGYDPSIGEETTRVEYNFNNQREELDGAVSVSLSGADSQAMGLEDKSHFQTLYADGVLSHEYTFREEPTLLAFRDGVPTLLTKPEQQLNPIEAAHEVMGDVTAALRGFEKARASGNVSSNFHRHIVVDGGLTIEDLDMPMPDARPNTAPANPRALARFARAAKTLLGQTIDYLRR